LEESKKTSEKWKSASEGWTISVRGNGKRWRMAATFGQYSGSRLGKQKLDGRGKNTEKKRNDKASREKAVTEEKKAAAHQLGHECRRQ